MISNVKKHACPQSPLPKLMRCRDSEMIVLMVSVNEEGTFGTGMVVHADPRSVITIGDIGDEFPMASFTDCDPSVVVTLQNGR